MKIFLVFLKCLRRWQDRYQHTLTPDKKKFFMLYKGIDGFALSKKARAQTATDLTLTYGEIDYDTFSLLLNYVQPKPGEIFYDLGSGVGKAVFAAALQYPLKKAVGIELLENLHQAACECLTRYEGSTLVEFRHGDLHLLPWLEADIVFINATCFFGAALDKLIKQCCLLKSGTRLIITSKSLPSSHFLLQNRASRHMSWGFATLSIYLKI